MVSKPKKLTPAQIEENHGLLSKADIAEMLNISSQLLANKAARAAERGEYFPEPTYSNRSGTVTLYTLDDAKEVYEYVTKAERERLAKAEAAFKNFGLSVGGQKVEEPTLDLEEKPAAKADPKPEAKPEAKSAPAEVKAEPKIEAKVEDKVAPKVSTSTKPADAKPVAVTDAKAPEVKADAAKTAPKAPATAPNKAGAPAKVGSGAAFGITNK